MTEPVDAPNVMIHPPIALGMALVVSFALNWIYPLPFVPPDIPPFITLTRILTRLHGAPNFCVA